MSYAKEWGDVFNKAAVSFTKEIHAFKAKKSTLAPFMEEQLEPIQRPLKLLQALVTIDKIELDGGSDRGRKELPAQLKLYAAALKKLNEAVKAYGKACDDVLKLKPTVKNEKSLMLTPTPIKELMPDSYRQLKLLKTEADALYARAENYGATKAATFKKEEIDKSRNKALDKAGDDNDKRKAVMADVQMEKFVLDFATSFKSSMAKGAHGIQQIKADPSLENYNKVMNNLGRDISQNLNNIVKLQANAKFKSSSLAKKLPPPGSLSREITPFADGDLRHLDQGVTEAVIKGHLKTFTTLYKTIATTYKDVLAGKLK